MSHNEPLGLSYPVYLVRHGETESNLLKRYAGRGAEPLTSRGRHQAMRISRVLRRERPCTVYSSRIERARETAALIASSQGQPVRTDARLDELLMGAWEGLTESEITNLYPHEWDLWCRRPHQLDLPGRETLRDVEHRIMSVVLEAARSGPSILVTHVAPIRVATLAVLALPLSLYKRVDVPNATCVRLDLTRGAAVRYPTGASIRSEVVGDQGELAIA